MNSRLTAFATALFFFFTTTARADEPGSAAIDGSDTELADPITWGLYAYMLNTEWKGGIGLRRTVKWGEGEQLVLFDKAMIGAPTVLLIEPKAPGQLKRSRKANLPIHGPDRSVQTTR